MAIITRVLTPDDAEKTAALMRRIEADHPTGFCLGVAEIVDLMRSRSTSVFEGAFDGDELVAFTTLFHSAAGPEPQRFKIYGDVDPARLGEGLGTLMLGRALDRARTIHAVDAPGGTAQLATTALAGREDQADLMRACGLRVSRHSFFMVADLTEVPLTPTLPEGIDVTPFDPANGEELRLAHNAAFAGYPDRGDAGVEFWNSFMVTASHSRPELAAIARDVEGAVAGYAFAHEYAVPPSGGAGREVHVPSVGTLLAHRRRGVATALLARVLQTAREHGYATASLNVDTDNPTGALGLYERAGFHQAHRQDSYHLDE